MDSISVADMLKVMQSRSSDGELIPFSITFVTCDRKKKTGGQKITLEKAISEGSGKSKSKLRNPDHYRNYTRNIRSVDGDKIIKIHPLLVTRFNGQTIML